MTKTDEDYDTFSDFTIKTERKRKYDTEFDSYGPQACRLSEEKVRNIVKNWSELPDSTLDKIMELSDQEKDGSLDRYEFTVAFHLADRAYSDYQIPDKVIISPHKTLLAPQ